MLADAGAFKEAPYLLGPSPWSDATFATAAPERVVPELLRLFAWFHQAPEHPLVRVEVFYHEFLGISPFREGSGHTGRALAMVLLRDLRYEGVGWTSLLGEMWMSGPHLEAAYADSREESGDLTPWLQHLSGAWCRAFGEAAERARFRRRLPQGLSERGRRVAAWMARSDVVLPGTTLRLGDIHAAFQNIPRRSLQRELTALCEAGVLEVRGGPGTAKYRIAGSVELEEKVKEAERADEEGRRGAG